MSALPPLDIRLAGPTDIEPAREVTNTSWIATYSPLIGESVTREIIEGRHSSVLFKEQATNPGHLFHVAVRDGVVVGHCYSFPKDGWYVDRLHVAQSERGRGTGRALLAATEATLNKGDRIWLDVLTGNDAAMGFYTRVGYARVGETDACGGLAGIPAIIFEKTITGA